MQRIAGREHVRYSGHRNRYGVDARTLRRQALRGEMTKLRCGAFVDTAVWESLDPQQRMRLEAAAVHDSGRVRFIASHASAAALWEVPRIGAPDGLVHTLTSAADGTRTENGLRKHAVADLDLHRVLVHGIPCTSIERTVLDLAMTEPFVDAVVALDWALREHTSEDALHRALEELDPMRGRAKAERVLAFGDGRSGSVGESYSRALMAEHGFPVPVLQQRFDDHRGLIGFVDFFWPDFSLIGEFDGLVKYSDLSMLRGRTPADALVDEKIREDRLRSTGNRCIRWIWATLRQRGALAAQLRAAGLPSSAAIRA
ncbi:hypothetical protein [Amnibacterium endophyticum]|uniref:AbiEi antitoxin C-terminal domain-containing protein n=1 Tax=Amnibacterium endophyticum TaxID=2109337 RepID=A0ABW4LG84_9MICO